MLILLHNIRSAHNVGSIFRTADAAGCEKIYLCGITPAPIDKYGRVRQQITKVALGAEKYVPWESAKSTTRLINKLKKDGYTILAVEQSEQAIPYFSYLPSSVEEGSGGGVDKNLFCHSERNAVKRRISTRSFGLRLQDDKKRNIALILGNELTGLSPTILKRADKILEIPMRGKKESLNVAVAFGIIVFHIIHILLPQ